MNKAEVSLVVADAALRQPAEKLAAALGTHLPQTDIKVAEGELSPPRGLPLLTYTDAAEKTAVRTKKFIQDTHGKCCVVLVHEDFPFIDSLRKRARQALGEMEMLEVSAKGGNDAQLQKVAEKLKPMVKAVQAASPPAEKTEVAPPPKQEVKPAPPPAESAKPTPTPPPVQVVKATPVPPPPPPPQAAKPVPPPVQEAKPASPVASAKPTPPPVQVVQSAPPPQAESAKPKPTPPPAQVTKPIPAPPPPAQEAKPASPPPVQEAKSASPPPQESKPTPPPAQVTKPAPATTPASTQAAKPATPSSPPPPAQAAKPASAPPSTPASPPAQTAKAATPASPSTAESAKEEVATAGKIDLLALTEQMDFPLPEVYEHLAPSLPQPTPDPLKDTITDTYGKIQKILKVKALYKGIVGLDRGLVICLLLLADRSMKTGNADPAVFLSEAHKLIDDSDDELRPLKHICVILLTQLYIEKDKGEAEAAAQLLETIATELDKEVGTRRQPMLHAATLDALVKTLAHTPRREEAEKYRKQYDTLLAKLNAEQRSAIGAATAATADSPVGALREKIGDVL